MLRARLAVTAIGLPLLAGLMATPEAVFGAAVAAVLAAAAFELMRAAAPQSGYAPAFAAGTAVALLVAFARTVDAFQPWTLLPVLAVALAVQLPASRRPRYPAGAWWLTTVLYVGVLGAHWPLLRILDDGQAWVVVALAATFATDSGAYAVGRLLGRHRMAPRLSPGKTWEGAGGGLVAGAAAAVAAVVLLDLDPEFAAVPVIALGLPVAAMAGDLLESAIKRSIGVGDMSNLLPGHGGLLDRLDSLLLTGPLLYWTVQWLAT